MHRDLIHQLDEAVAEVFAVMFNLACASHPIESARFEDIPRFPEPEAEPPQLFTASVLFFGPLEGRCCLQIDERAASELAANLTGISPREIPPDLCADTVGELCNMIAGSWKKRHHSDLATSLLSCPTVAFGSCRYAAADAFRQAITLLYEFGGHQLTVRLAFN